MPENDRLAIFERWAERYDQSVQTDKGIFASYDLVIAEVVRAAGVEAGMCVLELGIGTGNLAQQFVALSCEVWGVDFSPAMLAIAQAKIPQVRLIQMDLTAEWPETLQQRFDRIVANFVLHEFDLETKISLLQRLATHHLVEQGVIVVGDVAFPTAEARRQSGAESWDEDEYYWAADETIAACAGTGLEITFRQISWCTGVFVVKLASTI
ncbi:MAG: putative methyltransferase [Chloroflexota bacterium]|nr:MAG: putative methyltransferase [Chloroflexota bacterium]